MRGILIALGVLVGLVGLAGDVRQSADLVLQVLRETLQPRRSPGRCHLIDEPKERLGHSTNHGRREELKATTLDPKDKVSWNNLGRAYNTQREFASAKEALERAIRHVRVGARVSDRRLLREVLLAQGVPEERLPVAFGVIDSSTLEDLGPCKQLMKVSVPADEVKKEIEGQLQDVRKTAAVEVVADRGEVVAAIAIASGADDVAARVRHGVDDE